MFGKKEEVILKPMAVYPNERIKEIKNCLSGKQEYTIKDVNWDRITQIFIDVISINKDCVLYIKKENTPTCYTKAWRKGLGLFIRKDLKLKKNLDKYKFIHYEINNKIVGALIRFVDNDEFATEEDLEEAKKFKAITFYKKKESKEEKMCSILRIFPIENDTYEDEDIVSWYAPIGNIADDNYFNTISDIENMSSTFNILETDEEITNVEASSSDKNTEIEYVNQENLF